MSGLKGDKYETLEEIKFRLENTVVLYDNKPVYITRVRMPEDAEEAKNKEIARVFFVDLPYGKVAAKLDRFGDPVDNPRADAKEQRKYLSSKNFDLAPFKMGYFNFKGEAIFASRNPVRQNKQGLSQQTASFLDVRGKNSVNINFGMAIGETGFSDMVAGIFPDFKDVGDLLEGKKDTSSVAVSRAFAFLIDHDLEALMLMHKGTKCGIALKGDKALRIPPKFHFLRHEAEECRIPIA